MADYIVAIQPTPVMYVSGDRRRPIVEQAPATIELMEARVSSLRGRRCYGVVIGDEYRACVTMLAGDDPAKLGLGLWELPGGRYVRRKLLDFHLKVHEIALVFEELMRRDDYDASRPNVEYYRSDSELQLMVPVNQ